MEAQLVQIREQQKEVWNRFSPGLKKWDDLTMDFLKPMADAIIQGLRPKDTDIVPDVASGTGEPGLTIATMLSGGKLIPGNRKIYWNFMTEVAAPVVAALSNADCEMKVRIRNEVFNQIKQKYPNGALAIDSNAFVIYGEK
jgi:hypothetical protein